LLAVSPGWIDTMKLHLIDGRDFRVDEPSSQVVIVNQAFVRQFFPGQNPVHRTFSMASDRAPTEIVGIVNDAAYRSLREPIPPVAYIPLLSLNGSSSRKSATLIVRTATANPVSLGPALRQAIHQARPDFLISNIRTQEEINRAQTVRERLLAMLALFFAVVAVLLAGIGLYGVLDYSVLQRRREIGIRIAIGAPVLNIARIVTLEVFAFIAVGAIAGLALGAFSARSIESLFYEVKATDGSMLAISSAAILALAVLAALRPVIHALRVDPVMMLRME
jgi:ABC-type lipoprotein release transport system permease subunit